MDCNKIINQFDDEELDTIPDPNKEYWYNVSKKSRTGTKTKTKGMTILMKQVLLSKLYPQVIDNIKFLVKNKFLLNQQNERGWTQHPMGVSLWLALANWDSSNISFNIY